MSTLMLDPVLLPSSNVTVDRSTIARHLLRLVTSHKAQKTVCRWDSVGNINTHSNCIILLAVTRQTPSTAAPWPWIRSDPTRSSNSRSYSGWMSISSRDCSWDPADSTGLQNRQWLHTFVVLFFYSQLTCELLAFFGNAGVFTSEVGSEEQHRSTHDAFTLSRFSLWQGKRYSAPWLQK